MYICVIHSHINLYTMFILRKLIPTQGISNHYRESNEVIGESYQLVPIENKTDFDEILNSDDYWVSVSDKIYSFLIYENGSKTLPLYRKQKNYMMTDTGNTFANLSER